MTSRKRLVALLCLAAVVLLALSPSGIGVATLPLSVSLVRGVPCSEIQHCPETPRPPVGVVPFLPSRAPPLA